MKNIVLLFLLTFSAFTAAFAIGSKNGGNAFDSGNCHVNCNAVAAEISFASFNWPQWLITHLENGGEVPMIVAVAVIREARAWGQQNFGLNQGQMIVKYLQGLLTVEYISTAPPTMTFKVSFGGGIVIIALEDLS